MRYYLIAERSQSFATDNGRIVHTALPQRPARNTGWKDPVQFSLVVIWQKTPTNIFVFVSWVLYWESHGTTNQMLWMRHRWKHNAFYILLWTLVSSGYWEFTETGRTPRGKANCRW